MVIKDHRDVHESVHEVKVADKFPVERWCSDESSDRICYSMSHRAQTTRGVDTQFFTQVHDGRIRYWTEAQLLALPLNQCTSASSASGASTHI
jgi:hypothetical protein